jgi:E3 ubiquitin-protein ligase UBR4
MLTPLAEACLEALAGSGTSAVAESIAALRAATAAEMRSKAARKREAMLASMGMVQIEAAAEAGGGIRILPSPGGVPALSPLAAELAALEGSVEDDEGGNVCMVCREGYGLQPATLLGCYCFCRVAAAVEWPGCAPPWGTPYDLLFTTVSHFNLIHVNCHAAAKAADASLRQPKREWEGATLRNGSVLCNSLLPLPSPAGGKVETAYAAAVTSFWQQQLSAPSRESSGAAGSSSGRAGGAVAVAVSLSRRSSGMREADSSLLRVSLVAADLATLLWRFSALLSFSEEARGGGRASNARLLFALLQLGRYYVVEAPTNDLKKAQKLLTAAGGVAAALGLEPAAAAAAVAVGAGTGAQSSSSSTAKCSTGELSELGSHAVFVLALSLLAMGPTEWMSVRRSMLALAVRAGVAQALQQPTAADGSSSASSSHRRSSSGASPSAATSSTAARVEAMSDQALYDAAAPMLRLFGYVDWLHQWAKPALGPATSSSSGSGSSGSDGKGWGGAMAQQLQGLQGCADAAGELLEVMDEAEESLGLQDLLDGLGLLGLVLGPKCSSCEQFVRQAVAGL